MGRLIPFALVLIAAVWSFGQEAQQHKIDVGLQLYSLRNQIPKDVPGTLKLIWRDGHHGCHEAASFYGLSAEQFRQELDKAGLHASGAHFQWTDFGMNIEKVIKDTKTIGAEYVTLPWIPHTGRFTEQNAHTTLKHLQ